MKVKDKRSGEWHKAEIIELSNFAEIISDERFDFDWNKEKQYAVFQMRLLNTSLIIGLISLQFIPNELRVFIRLLEVSKENRGVNKEIEGIAGCLIAYACRLSFEKDYEGFVSLIPKTELIDHYRQVYGFEFLGQQMCLEGTRSEILIKRYLENEE